MIMVTNDDGSFDVLTITGDVSCKVKDAITSASLESEQAEVTMRASTNVALDADAAKQMLRLLDMLDDADDVQQVYSNADIAEEILAEFRVKSDGTASPHASPLDNMLRESFDFGQRSAPPYFHPRQRVGERSQPLLAMHQKHSLSLLAGLMASMTRILGIDPGSRITGFGVARLRWIAEPLCRHAAVSVYKARPCRSG